MTGQYEIFDPFADGGGGGDDLKTDLAKLGWIEFMSLGEDDSPLHITSYCRPKPDGAVEYLVDVWDVNFGSPFLRFDRFPDVMDLFARWAPAVQAAAVVNLINDVQSGSLSPYGAVERIAAKAAYGAEDVLPTMRRQMVEELARMQRHRDARQQAKRVAGATD